MLHIFLLDVRGRPPPSPCSRNTGYSGIKYAVRVCKHNPFHPPTLVRQYAVAYSRVHRMFIPFKTARAKRMLAAAVRETTLGENE